MEWSVESMAEFDEWWESLDEEAQDAVDVVIGMLEEVGPRVPFPYSSDIRGSRYGALRELNAFDPRRVAVLLLGDDKGGSKRWYRKAIARADRVFDRHLEDLKGGA